MRLVTFKQRGGTPQVGELGADGSTLWPLQLDGALATNGVLLALDALQHGRPLVRESAITLAAVELLAPIPRPRRNIFCVGKNYHEHVKEFARSGYDSSAVSEAPPEAPIIFSKLPE